jgi:hypothetical protein
MIQSQLGPPHTVKTEIQKWLWKQQDNSFHHSGLECLIVQYDKYHNKFGGYMKTKWLVSKQPCALLVSTYLHSSKINRQT